MPLYIHINKRSNQSILKETCSEYSLEGLMLKLKLQYFGYLMWGADSMKKIQMLGKVEGRRRRGQQRMRWLDGITRLNGHEFEWSLGVGDGQGGLVCCDSWGRKESDMTEQLNWVCKSLEISHSLKSSEYKEEIMGVLVFLLQDWWCSILFPSFWNLWLESKQMPNSLWQPHLVITLS